MQEEFSKFESQVSVLLKAKVPITTIATTLNKPIKSIKNAIQRINKKTKEKNTLKRVKEGRVYKLTKREERVINRDLTKDPKKENSQLLVENDLNISKRSLQRFLRKENYSVNIASKKALLNKDKAKKRLCYAKDNNRNIKKINLNKIVFSNEAAIKRGKGGRREYYRKRQKNRVSKELVSRTNRGKLLKSSYNTFLSIQTCLFISINFIYYVI